MIIKYIYLSSLYVCWRGDLQGSITLRKLREAKLEPRKLVSAPLHKSYSVSYGCEKYVYLSIKDSMVGSIFIYANIHD